MKTEATQEMLAVFHEDGTPADTAVSRTKAHEKGILHGASHIYIYRFAADGSIEILLQRRSAGKDSFPNCLDTSSAGHVEAGMGFDDTARKELNEELGLVVSPNALRYAFTQRIHQVNDFHGKLFDDREINRVYLLEYDVDPATLHLQAEEVSTVVWMDSAEILQRLEAGDREFCLDKEEYRRVLSALEKLLAEN